MATITNWNPYGVSLNIIASARSIKRTSSNQFTATLDVAWEVYYSGNKTNFGMKASSGGQTYIISSFGTKRASGSGSFTGTYSVTANSAATVTIPVVFTNYEENYKGEITKQSSKTINLSVTVPAWTSYTVSYNANGGSGAPSAQTKWRDQTLKLSTTKPTRTGYTFQGWATVMTGGVEYASGGNYTSNSNVTLYAVWKAVTYTVSYNANGGSGAPAAQTKTYGVTLKLSTTKPTKTDYKFKGWGTSSTSTTVSYAAGSNYTANAGITLYAIWELAYVRPRIAALSVDRCTSNGTINDEGTYARVKFNWASDKTVTSVKIEWKISTSSSYTNSVTATASGTGGSVNQVVGSGALNGDHTYDFRITVTDSGGSTSTFTTLAGITYIMDILANGKGIAFGKPAETTDLAEFEYPTRFNKDIYTSNGPIQTSDRNLKENILVVTEQYEELFSKLKPVTFELIDEKHDKIHVGFIAQDVNSAMVEVGLSDQDFAGYCAYTKENQNGQITTIYSLRYTEFIALNTHMIQKQQAEIDILKNEIDSLKADIARLTAVISGAS